MVTNPRTCLVNFRLTNEEHAQVKLAAKAAGARLAAAPDLLSAESAMKTTLLILVGLMALAGCVMLSLAAWRAM